MIKLIEFMFLKLDFCNENVRNECVMLKEK